MVRRLLAVLIGGALAASASALSAQTSVSVAGGLSAPIARLGDVTDLGYNVAASLNLGGTTIPVGVRLEGAYNSFGFKNGGGDVRILNATANAIFNLGLTASAPYLIGGLGYYNRKFAGTGLPTNDANALGVNLGGGLRFPLVGLSTFFEARVHAMLGEERNAGTYKFIPITFGITF